MMRRPFVSVIIPTLNREEVLRESLKSLFKQSYNNFEIIIIDQSDIKIGDKLKEIINISPVGIKYIHILEKGLPNARNVGIKHSRGEIVIFLDDDILADRNLIHYHVENYKEQKVGSIAGRSLEENEPYTNTKKIGGTVLINGIVLRNFAGIERADTKYALGVNMSFSRRAIDKVGLFDTRYIGTSVMEEADYCYRMRKKGYKIIYEPRAYVMHMLHSQGGCRENKLILQEYFRFHNTMLFYLKNMKKIFLPIFFITFIALYIKNIIKRKYTFLNSLVILKALLDGYYTYRNKKNISKDESSKEKNNKK